MIGALGLLAAGGALLYFGAEWLVRGASGIATKLHLRPLVIGLTVVAYGTSAPELVVGIGAALSGRGGIAFGNAVGSNIANFGLILGVTALVYPPNVDASLRRRELPVMILSALLVPTLLIDGRISRMEGFALLAGSVIYTAAMLRAARHVAPEKERPREEDAKAMGEAAGVASATAVTKSTRELAVVTLAGLVLLLLGGHWLVDGASRIASGLGVSERLIGLTIVAIGTSIPELATSLVAARRGHSDLAVGNVVGSNIFNVLLILGASGVAGPFELRFDDARLDLAGLLLMTFLGAFFLRRERRVSRVEGAVLLVAYVLFLAAAAIAPRT